MYVRVWWVWLVWLDGWMAGWMVFIKTNGEAYIYMYIHAFMTYTHTYHSCPLSPPRASRGNWPVTCSRSRTTAEDKGGGLVGWLINWCVGFIDWLIDWCDSLRTTAEYGWVGRSVD